MHNIYLDITIHIKLHLYCVLLSLDSDSHLCIGKNQENNDIPITFELELESVCVNSIPSNSECDQSLLVESQSNINRFNQNEKHLESLKLMAVQGNELISHSNDSSFFLNEVEKSNETENNSDICYVCSGHCSKYRLILFH